MEITARPRRRRWVRPLRAALVAACIVSVAVLLPAAFGYGTHAVGDDAMRGGYPRGALVLDEQLTRGQLAVGDVVALVRPGTDDTVVRRVVAVDQAGVRTAGDASGPDPWVVPESAVARVAFTVPVLGWPLLGLASVSVPGWLPAVLVLGLAVLLLGVRLTHRRPSAASAPVVPAAPEDAAAAPQVPPAA